MGKFILGLFIGLGAGGVVSGLYFKNKYQKESADERAETRKYYKEKLDNLNAKLNEVYAQISEEEIASNMNSPVKEAETPEEARDETEVHQKINYNDISTKKARAKKELEYEDYLKVVDDSKYKEVNTNKKLPRPYIITDTDFHEDNLYDKLSLIYHAKAGTVENVEGDIIENGLDLIGVDNLEFFGEYEPDTLFIRNEVYGSDFEVTLDDSE